MAYYTKMEMLCLAKEIVKPVTVSRTKSNAGQFAAPFNISMAAFPYIQQMDVALTHTTAVSVRRKGWSLPILAKISLKTLSPEKGQLLYRFVNLDLIRQKNDYVILYIGSLYDHCSINMISQVRNYIFHAFITLRGFTLRFKM